MRIQQQSTTINNNQQQQRTTTTTTTTTRCNYPPQPEGGRERSTRDITSKLPTWRYITKKNSETRRHGKNLSQISYIKILTCHTCHDQRKGSQIWTGGRVPVCCGQDLFVSALWKHSANHIAMLWVSLATSKSKVVNHTSGAGFPMISWHSSSASDMLTWDDNCYRWSQQLLNRRSSHYNCMALVSVEHRGAHSCQVDVWHWWPLKIPPRHTLLFCLHHRKMCSVKLRSTATASRVHKDLGRIKHVFVAFPVDPQCLQDVVEPKMVVHVLSR